MEMFGAFRAAREIVIGAGQRRALGGLTRPFGTRALVCTDARMGADPLFAELMDTLSAAGVETTVYDQTVAELPLDCVSACVDLARSANPQAIVAVGGGSCMDLAKVVATLLAHGGTPQDYYGEFKVPGPVLPLVAVPTTAGTGSEVTPVAVLADPGRTMKVGIASPHLIPHTAICDPELTYSCPPALTAVSGSDALTHAIEAFTAVRRPRTSELVQQHVFVGKNALSDHFALGAIRAIGGSLRRAFENGHDEAARDQMMLGSLLAGMAFGTAGTAAAHAIQYPVGAATHTPHGTGVALLLPYVMEYNKPACTPELAQIARALGVGDTRADEGALADLAIQTVADLFAAVGIPRTLQELGLAEDRQRWTAEQALTAARLVKNNPRALALEDIECIVRAAFTGERAALQTA